MGLQNFNVGTAPNDGTGDKLRDAFVKAQAMFAEIYAELNAGTSTAVAAAQAAAAAAQGYATAAAAGASAVDITLTRDPLARLRAKLAQLSFGTQVMTAGYPTNTKTTINVAIFGDSLGLGQGASSAFTPAAQVTATVQRMWPEANIVVRVFAVTGSWIAQMGSQIDAMVASGFVPDISIIMSGTNDGTTTIWHSLEGPNVFRDRLTSYVQRLAPMSVVMVASKPPVHPTNSLAQGRFDMSADFFPTYPSAGFYAGDGYQEFTYDATAQTIANTTPGAFKIFANGWLAPGQWIRIDPRVYGAAIFAHIWDWDAPGTTLLVDDGNGVNGARGGAILPSTKYSTVGLYQGKINARTQYVPARNENDLSRPAGVSADVPLSIEPRDINNNGVLIDISLRHEVIERIAEEVTLQQAALWLPWGRKVRKLLTSNAVYDQIYPPGGDYHPNDEGYAPFGESFAEVLSHALYDTPLVQS